jgi:peptidoglycan glycosyltransferase
MKAKGNRSLIFTGAVFTALLAVMMIYVSWYSYAHRVEFVDNSYNRRASQLARENKRGRILSCDGEELAVSDVDSEGNEKRIYPYGEQFAHVVGFSEMGGSGIEDLANYYLLSCDASLSTRAEYQDKGLKFPGNDVHTTVNASLQRLAYYSLGNYDGAVIISNPKTGAILAMVSRPDFDPNDISGQWKTLSEDKQNAPLLNRAAQGLYPPGSTFKIVTSLEYIRENQKNYNDFHYKCSGSFTYEGTRIGCFHNTVHGDQDFSKAFANSCNSAFADIGVNLDQKQFASTLDGLMFNTDLPACFPVSKSKAVAGDNISNDSRMQLAIGQGTTLVTPLHINMITMAIANRGKLMKPYLLESVESADRKTVKTFGPEEYGTLMTEEESRELTELMKGVVNGGTAKGLRGMSYNAAGKTGSAEFRTGSTDSHAWFTGFAPAQDPQICVTVIMEKAGSGGHMAVPVAKRIFDEYFEGK